MPYEPLSLDTAVAAAEFPTVDEIDHLAGRALRAAASTGVAVAAASTGVAEAKVRTLLLKDLGLKAPRLADEHDCREALRMLRVWIHDPASCTSSTRIVKPKRPEGCGQLPVPRVIKPAHSQITCALCLDPVKAGELTGRFRPVSADFPYAQLGWLCQHCLYARREQPRLRDVILRLWHQDLAGLGTDLNARECQLLHTLLSPGELRATTAWQTDPLDDTLPRLRTAVSEDKRSTALAVTSVRTLINVLLEVSPAPADAVLLRPSSSTCTNGSPTPSAWSGAATEQVCGTACRPWQHPRPPPSCRQQAAPTSCTPPRPRRVPQRSLPPDGGWEAADAARSEPCPNLLPRGLTSHIR